MDRKIIAACGNDCSVCPRYSSPPFEKSHAQLKNTAELWKKIGYRDTVVSEEEISCTGCKPDNNCRYDIIGCVSEKNIHNCGECCDFPCTKILSCFDITMSFEPSCRSVCSDIEYDIISRAFFEKEKNLRIFNK